MRPQYSIVTQPASEPITYAQAADHLRVDSTADVQYITDLIPVAREYVDSITGRASSQTTFKVIAGSWQDLFEATSPDGESYLDPRYGTTARISGQQVIPLWRTPLISVSNVKYYAPDAASLTTMSSALYNVVTSAEPGRIHIPDSLPAVDDRIDAIQITFVAGNASPPAVSRHCVKMLVAHLYENRMPVAFASCNEIPYTLKDLITNQKTGGFF
jgi:hypothetical protein